ncbi:MAG: hypothetical protein M9900_14835 [Flavobacteriales bacterium]|nr:hypothetical protein [Flavobacteriales bacterium]HRO40462.1 hypothetical protein [Flavobacteriales bacterium]HRP82385.1 hypothetical protein [Flavobacteriales bacterium]
MTDFFFAIGHFTERILSIIVAAGWVIPVIFIAVLSVAAVYWLVTEQAMQRKAKENGDFI